MVQELLGKYIWLIQTLTRAGDSGLTLSEIQDRWYDRFETEYARRSFNNHRTAIFDVFGVEIACNRRTNRYYIADNGRIENSKDMTRWLIDTFTVNSMVMESHDRLKGRVSMENIPTGQTRLAPIMDAMLTESTLHITYRKYGGKGSEELDVDPYAIKEYARRWYLVGYCHQREAIRVYGIDRIISVQDSDMDFDMPKDFDIDRLFEGSFGIYISNDEPETIIIRTGTDQAGYIRDLPLHSSQREYDREEVERMGLDPEYDAVFSIRVCPGKDLMMELCRFGDKLEILSPARIREDLKEEFRKALNKYEQNEQ